MGRTESKTMKVHPDNEQSTIDIMQRFHWNLGNSQDVKNQTSYLKRDGDKIVQVKETEHFVNLLFSREVDNPNLGRLKELEGEYFGINLPAKPGIVFPAIIGIVLLLVSFSAFSSSIATGIVALALAGASFWWVQSNLQKGKNAEEVTATLLQRKNQILLECDSL